MTVHSPRSVYAPGRNPPKSEIIQLLEQIMGSASAPAVVKETKAQLDLVTPAAETYGGQVLNDPDPTKNGYYYRDSAAWVKGRGFPDTFAQITLGGTANAQTGAIAAGVNPADALVYFSTVSTDNTGPMTLSISGETARDVVNAAGNALSAGEWTGTVLFFLNGDGDYQLLFDAGAAAAAAASASAAGLAKTAAELARDQAQAAASSVSPTEFPDVATAEAITPVSAPDFIRTAGYTSAGDGGGALYKKVASEPSHSGKFSITLDDGVTVVWYELADFVPAIATDTFPSTESNKLREHAISLFDFIPPDLRDGIAARTYTGDVGTYWQNFRDALLAQHAAGARAVGLIPSCKIHVSTTPNFAIPELCLLTEGVPEIISTASGTDSAALLFDGYGGGINGYGPINIICEPIQASGANVQYGIFIRCCHNATFYNPRSLGAYHSGIRLQACVTTILVKPYVSPTIGPWVSPEPPLNGITMTGRPIGEDEYEGTTSWCELRNPTAEYTQTGIFLDAALGNIIGGGTAEQCVSGVVISNRAGFNKLIGIDLELNSDTDCYCAGELNDFVGVDSAIRINFAESARGNRIIGGTYQQIEFGGATQANLVSGATYNRHGSGALSDVGVKNVFQNVYDYTNNKMHSGLLVKLPVTPVAGTQTVPNDTNGNLAVIVSGASYINWFRTGQTGSETGMTGGFFLLGPDDYLVVAHDGSATIDTYPI